MLRLDQKSATLRPLLRMAAVTAAMLARPAPAAQSRPAIDPPGTVAHRETSPARLGGPGLDWSSATIGAGLASRPVTRSQRWAPGRLPDGPARRTAATRPAARKRPPRCGR